MSLADAVVAVATYPPRLLLAASQATLGLGRLSSAEGPLLRPGGYGERLAVLRELLAPDRPLGQAVAEGGTLDRLFSDDGPVSRLVGRGGALERLLAEEGAVERLLAADGPLERLLAPGGALDQLVSEHGTLDQLVALGGTLEDIRPRRKAPTPLSPPAAAH